MKRRDFFKLLGITALVSFSARTASARVCEKQNALLDRIYPIGSIYISVSDANPKGSLGGEWVRFAEGRTLVGVGTSDRTFPAGEKDGESKHKLLPGEMPKHNHSEQSYLMNINPGIVLLNSSGSGSPVAYDGKIPPAGADQPHNNLQPYITVYIWRRIP